MAPRASKCRFPYQPRMIANDPNSTKPTYITAVHEWGNRLRNVQLGKVTVAEIGVELISAIERELIAISREGVEHPELITADPFCENWIASLTRLVSPRTNSALCKGLWLQHGTKRLLCASGTVSAYTCVGRRRHSNFRCLEPSFVGTASHFGERLFYCQCRFLNPMLQVSVAG